MASSSIADAEAREAARKVTVARAMSGLSRFAKTIARGAARSGCGEPLTRPPDLEHAGITGTTVTAMIVRGLVQRDPAGRVWLTQDGRTVLAALLSKGG